MAGLLVYLPTHMDLLVRLGLGTAFATLCLAVTFRVQQRHLPGVAVFVCIQQRVWDGRA